MKKILVTGGAGYIGSHACKALKEAGYLPVTFDNLSTGNEEVVRYGPLIKGDLLHPADLKKLFEEHTFAGVMHFAASALVVESLKNPSKYFQNNVTGTLHLLDACVQHGVRSFVFSSSCATYGIPETIPITEETPQNPISPYGISKWMAEKLLEQYDKIHGVRFASLRYFNAAGASFCGTLGEKREEETHLIPLVLQTALGKREKFTIFGNSFPTKDGYAFRDFIHVLDIIDAHIKALEFLQTKEESFHLNLGSGKGFSVKEILSAAEKVSGKKIAQEIQEARLGEPAALIADTSKAKKLLNFTPKHSDIKTILETAYNWETER